MQCPGCQHENRPQAKFCEECATALNARTASGPYTSSLGEITAALSEARAQQAATAEILRVISNSPTDLQPVFDTIVESVVQLCGGVSAFVYRFDGDLIHLSAHHHTVTSRARDVFERRYPAPPSRISMSATENSMARPSRGGMTTPNRMIAPPTTVMVTVWPTPQRLPMMAAVHAFRCRLTIVDTAMT